MLRIDEAAQAAVQPELTEGEVILWAGRPLQETVFHWKDLFLLPFGVISSAGSLLSLSAAFGFSNWDPSDAIPLLGGLVFLVVGQYLIWGRFVIALWKKRRTFYAVTTQRVIVVQNLRQRTVLCSYIDTMPEIMRSGRLREVSTLRFAKQGSFLVSEQNLRIWDPFFLEESPAFVDLEEADGVYHLVAALRAKARHAVANQVRG